MCIRDSLHRVPGVPAVARELVQLGVRGEHETEGGLPRRQRGGVVVRGLEQGQHGVHRCLRAVEHEEPREVSPCLLYTSRCV